MDLLFKRYASPFLYLDNLIDSGMLAQGIYQIIEADDNDKMWDVYLHAYSTPSMSFVDWKKAILEENQEPQTQSMSEDELKTAQENADRILNNFMRK